MIPKPVSDADVAAAGKVLKACKQIDPWFKNADMSNARGWAQLFVQFDFTLDELLGGVLEFYATAKSGEHAMPGQIIAGAKKTRAEKAASPDHKAEVEARRQAKREQVDARVKQRELEKAIPKPTTFVDEVTPQLDANTTNQMIHNLMKNMSYKEAS